MKAIIEIKKAFLKMALNWERPCNDFQAAPEASIVKRRKWRDGK